MNTTPSYPIRRSTPDPAGAARPRRTDEIGNVNKVRP